MYGTRQRCELCWCLECFCGDKKKELNLDTSDLNYVDQIIQ